MSFDTDDEEDGLREITLATLMNGEAEAMFQRELQKVLDNIADSDTELKKAREIVLKVSIVPSQDRAMGSISVSCGAKLAPYVGAATAAVLKKNGPHNIALEVCSKQGELDFGASDVPSIHREQAANE